MPIPVRFTKPGGETARLRSEVERLQAVIDAQTELAAAALDREAMLARAIRAVMDLTDADAGVVALAEDDRLVYRAVAGMATPHLGMELDAASSLAGRCLIEGQVLRC